MTHIRAYLTGYIVGQIWWPAGTECWKDLHFDCTDYAKRCTPRATLRDCVLAATNDGDFQGCDIAQGELVLETRKAGPDGRMTTRRKSYPLSRFPSIADCLHSDPDWWPEYSDEDIAA